MKAGRVLACVAVFQLVCGWGTLLEAKPKPGRIMGVVLDKHDARVARALVKVESKVDGSEFKWTGETDDAGSFTVKVPAGTYRIYLTAPGFRNFVSAFFTVKSGVVEMVNLHLEVAATQYLVPAESQKKPSRIN